MTPDEAVELMRKIADSELHDEESDHIDADSILCELLRFLGHNELVDLYRKVPKWYA